MKGNLAVFFLLAAMICSSVALGQERTVRGRVVDESGLPMIGATIVVEGTQQTGLIGTTANLDGNFTIQVPEGRNQLTITFTGYRRETINISGGDFFEIPNSKSKCNEELSWCFVSKTLSWSII